MKNFKFSDFLTIEEKNAFRIVYHKLIDNGNNVFTGQHEPDSIPSEFLRGVIMVMDTIAEAAGKDVYNEYQNLQNGIWPKPKKDIADTQILTPAKFMEKQGIAKKQDLTSFVLTPEQIDEMLAELKHGAVDCDLQAPLYYGTNDTTEEGETANTFTDMANLSDIVTDLLDKNMLTVNYEGNDDTLRLITKEGTVDVYFKNTAAADKAWEEWLNCTTNADKSYYLCKTIFTENINIKLLFSNLISAKEA